MKIIIIGQNEGTSIIPMFNSTKGFERTWVLDRCTDNSKNILRSLGEKNVILNTFGEGRKTSSCRNLGYSMIGSSDDVLFLDGDRYIVKGNLKDLENSETEVVLLKLQKDFRDSSPVPFEKVYGSVYNEFFSCGLYIKQSAQEKLKEFYKNHRDDYGNSIIFPETVEQFWGIEDTHLGDICYHLGISCSINENIRLQGSFERERVDGLDTIEQRFKLRDKLNVIW